VKLHLESGDWNKA